MLLSELCKMVAGGDVVYDCSFSSLHLLGKPRLENVPVLTYLADTEFVESFMTVNAAGVICTSEIYEKYLKSNFCGGVCLADSPKTFFFLCHNYLAEKTLYYGVPFSTIIGDGTKIHPTAVISSQNVRIGDNVEIGAYAVIKENVIVGDNSAIQEFCVVGANGFYPFGEESFRQLATCVGWVHIEENVTVGAHNIICLLYTSEAETVGEAG